MLLSIKDLVVCFQTYRGKITAVRGVSLDVNAGEMVGIVGESGCGKSVTAQAIMGLLPEKNSFIANGSINFNGQELTRLQKKDWLAVRGKDIAMIFQDPMTSLNPVLTIGTQLEESILRQGELQGGAVQERAIELLTQVGITEPEKRLKAYPHEFSGGMRQRVMIAMALAGKPKLLLADEPTTALDVTIQAQIMTLLKKLQRELNMAIILISHDLGVVAGSCDRVNVMYAGKVVEKGTVESIFDNPEHPYTQGLLKALPRLTDKRDEPLATIAGQPPDLLYAIAGCGFAPRCKDAMQVCLTHKPSCTQVESGHTAACWLLDARAPKRGDRS